MTRVLVTGAGGQVGQELNRAAWPSDVELVALPSRALDITDRAAVSRQVASARPAVIVNAAAYTAVDSAEDEPELAMAVNAAGVGNLAAAADRVGAMLVHFSTDYVFDGSKTGWYTEYDPMAPLGAYGRSKAAGEGAALSAERSIVLRVSWVYGALGSNFVTTMLRLATERTEIGVVADQVGCPTSSAEIARAVAHIVGLVDGGDPPTGVYHLAAPDPASWHELAVAIFDASSVGFDGDVTPLPTSEFPTRAQRPVNSRLDSRRIATDLGIELPPWRDSLARVVAELELSRV